MSDMAECDPARQSFTISTLVCAMGAIADGGFRRDDGLWLAPVGASSVSVQSLLQADAGRGRGSG